MIVDPGTYGSAGDPTDEILIDSGGALDIHGAAGEPMPVIYSNASEGVYIGHGSMVSRLHMIYSGTGDGLYLFNSDGAQMIIDSSAAPIACDLLGQLTDTVCVATAPGADAVESLADDSSAPIIRGVTAEATGAGGTGLYVRSDDDAVMQEDVTNSIIHGAEVDVSAVTDTASGSASVSISHSDVATITSSGPGPTSIGRVAGITTAPDFVDAAAGNYAESAASPTINKGAADPSSDTDAIGNPRTLGSAPDMGAYEFLQKPTATRLEVGAHTAHSAHLSVKVDPEGLATTVQVIASLHGHHVSSHEVSAHHGPSAKTIHLVLHGLKSGRRYTVHAVATSRASHARTVAKHFRTRH